MTKIVSFVLLFLTFIFGCSSPPPKKVTKEFAVVEFDSLHPAKPLDCSVSYYIVGRIRNTKIETNIPFKVNMIDLDSELYDKEIVLNIEDTIHYNIVYLKGDTETKIPGCFEEYSVGTDIALQVSKTERMKGLRSYFENNPGRPSKYMFIVSKK
jgi:hypothetical protein